MLTAGSTPIKREVTKMQLGILTGGAWNRAASVLNVMSAFKATEIFSSNQNFIPNHFFSICEAAYMSKATELVGSESHQLIIHLSTVFQQTREHCVILDTLNLLLHHLKVP
jgi:hypothetical protein